MASPSPWCFPIRAFASIEQEGMRVITLEKLVELKLASGMTASHRLRDLADVQDVIAALDLPENFAEHLNVFVRAKYLELWHSAHSQDIP